MPTRMHPQDYVLEHYPNAELVQYEQQGGRAYWILWSGGYEKGHRLADGTNRFRCWEKAAALIREQTGDPHP